MNTGAISGFIDPLARAEGRAVASTSGEPPERAAAATSSRDAKAEPAPLEDAAGERSAPGTGTDVGDDLLLRNLYRNTRLKLDFRIDEATEQVVISVIDPETEEVVRQVPPEEFLRMAERLDAVRGRLFSSTV